MPDLPPLTRRTALRLLTIGALGALAGCRPTRPRAASTPAVTSNPTASHGAGKSAGPSPVIESADELLVKRVAAAERALLAAYDTASSDHPELTDRLAPLRADHAAHLRGLLPGAATSAGPSAAVSPPASASASAPASAAAIATAGPSASDLVLDDLAALERAAAAARINDVLASTGSLARLLASIGGCEAAHAALLAVRA